jgi:MFS family permease
MGPVEVGIPLLADVRLAEGAAAFGIIISAFGAGSVLGILFSNVLPAPKPKHLGTILLLVMSLLGIGIALMSLFSSTAIVAIIALVVGVAAGYQQIIMMTWLQKRIPMALMGRVMSLLFFCSVGLAPVSNAVAGVILQFDLNALFIGGGLLMTVVTLLSILLPEFRHMGVEATARQSA